MHNPNNAHTFSKSLMENTDFFFESLLDQVEALHQAISTDDPKMTTLAQLLREKLGKAERAAAWLDRQELIRWSVVADEQPQLDVDVLVSWGDGQGTLIAALTTTGWVGTDCLVFDTEPRFWASLPVGPVDLPMDS